MEQRLHLKAATLNKNKASAMEAGKRTESKLKIISAFYGTGPVTDIDVTEVLRNHVKDGLIVLVTNELFGSDPAPNQPKRLQVEYSYGNYAVSVVSRPESTRLVLPEDWWGGSRNSTSNRSKRRCTQYGERP